MRTITLLILSVIAATASAQPPRLPAADTTFPESDAIIIDRSDYADRLHAMWLAQSIANWTGLRTEGCWREPPFATDADWGGDCGEGLIEFVLMDPWPADDDTDIEYTYVHLLHQHQVARLTPQQIADGWRLHINRRIWVSNRTARELMDRNVLPPATSIPAGNEWWLMIDAQLTTEIFGALAPGMPVHALDTGLLPMLTTSRSHATHAAQYFALLCSLVPLVPQELPPAEQVAWLSATARRYLPDSSKAADIIDFVTDRYVANPDPNDWEPTRDAIYVRYQGQDTAHGFRFQRWTESSVNLATGVMCLLYGQGDFRRTLQIGALSGWDSDNPTASIGGLLGLLYGRTAIENEFPGQQLSERYWIRRTRDNLPDYLPQDSAAEDNFTLLSSRMLPIIDRIIAAGGGIVDPQRDRWILPAPQLDQPLADSPTAILGARSANNWIRAQGGTVTAATSVVGQGSGTSFDIDLIADGFEFGFAGNEPPPIEEVYYSTEHPAGTTGEPQTLSVQYSREVTIDRVAFVEGPRPAGDDGGWFTDVSLEVHTAGAWTVPPQGVQLNDTPEPNTPLQMFEFTLPQPLLVRGVRITATAGGLGGWGTVAELDAFRVLPCELQDEVLTLLDCLSGPGVATDPGCACGDEDGDGDGDLLDWAARQLRD